MLDPGDIAVLVGSILGPATGIQIALYKMSVEKHNLEIKLIWEEIRKMNVASVDVLNKIYQQMVISGETNVELIQIKDRVSRIEGYIDGEVKRKA